MATIRQQVISAFNERFGEAQVGPDPAGKLYRWRLTRKNDLHVHVIIDSPEIETRAHVLISDPCHDMPPIRSLYVGNTNDIKSVLDEIEAQWQMRGCWSPHSPSAAARP